MRDHRCQRVLTTQPLARWALTALVFCAALMASHILTATQPDLVDLARAYRHFERVWDQHPPADADQVEDQNVIADNIARSFFGGNIGEAISRLNELSLQISNSQPTYTERFLASLAVDENAVEWVGPVENVLRIPMVRMYDVPMPAGDLHDHVSFVLQPRSKGGSIETAWKETAEEGAGSFGELEVPAERLSPSETYDGYWTTGEDWLWPLGTISVLPISRAQFSEQLADRMKELCLPPTREDVVIWNARRKALTDESSNARMTRWLLGPDRMMDEIERELTAIGEGKNPYRGKTGDLWLPIPGKPDVIPCRIFVPKRANTERLPLVIALHGAGGNEHMFFETYGAGRIRDLAESRGFVAVAPQTLAVTLQPTELEAFVDQLAKVVPFDRDRIYLMGHSMGAMAGMQLCSVNPDLLCRASLIAGGPRMSILVDRLPSIRVYGAECDILISAKSLKDAVTAAQEKSLPVEYREVQDYGHVLVTAKVLEEAVDWLLSGHGTTEAKVPGAFPTGPGR